MSDLAQFERYLEHLKPALRHRDRETGLRDYLAGLLAPLARKSVEPMAAQLDPRNTRSRHESLHHFVADSAWSDALLLARVAQWVVPKMDSNPDTWWVVGEICLPKHGPHIVGVAPPEHKTAGRVGNCQTAVSVSLAGAAASLPLAWRLYLPRGWADVSVRRAKAAVPPGVAYANRPAIALTLIERLLGEGAPRHGVLASPHFAADTTFRNGLDALKLQFVAAPHASEAAAAYRRSALDAETLRLTFGLGQYEGRGWRGVHHHASVCIAAYGFRLAQRLATVHPQADDLCRPPTAHSNARQAAPDCVASAFYRPRGSPAHAAPRPLLRHALMGAHLRSLPPGGNSPQIPQAPQAPAVPPDAGAPPA